MAGKPRRSGGKRKGAGRKPKPRHLEEYVEVGAPPRDPLESVVWAGKLVTIGMHKAAVDMALDERARGQAIRAGAAILVKLMPASRLLEAERTVRRYAENVQQVKTDPGVKDVSHKPAGSIRIDPK